MPRDDSQNNLKKGIERKVFKTKFEKLVAYLACLGFFCYGLWCICTQTAGGGITRLDGAPPVVVGLISIAVSVCFGVVLGLLPGLDKISALVFKIKNDEKFREKIKRLGIAGISLCCFCMGLFSIATQSATVVSEDGVAVALKGAPAVAVGVLWLLAGLIAGGVLIFSPSKKVGWLMLIAFVFVIACVLYVIIFYGLAGDRGAMELT